MPFTLKLSRRLAIARHVPLLVAGIALLAGCTTSDLATGTDAESSTIHPDYSQTKGGVTQDGPKGRGRGRRDQKATLVKLVVKPDPASVATGGSTRFAATGILSDGSETAAKVKWSASGGTIDSTGLYTAGRTPGSHRVLAQAISADLADTASVTIGGESATVTAIILSPASLTLQTGATQSLTASAQLSDGSSGPADVTYSATGGTITDAGAYTAGATAGTFRVIARQSGGTLADTSVVTVTASAPPPSSPPPPTSGKTFFSADGESGTLSPWSFSGSRPGADCSTNPCPSNSATRAKNGARSYKLEVTDPSADGHSTYLHTYYPQTSMGSPNGRYISGYYSGWYYIDAGFEATGRGQNGWTWNMALGWMAAAAINGNPDPISHIGFEVWDGVLQVVYVLKNAEVGNYPAPAIAGYRQEGRGGIYRMTAQSPNGITGLSRGRWVHLAVYYKMARTNGQVTIWQDGVKIMDLTAPTMNTMDGHVTMTSPKQDMILQVNIYEGIKSGTQRYYLDDFKVTDYQVVP